MSANLTFQVRGTQLAPWYARGQAGQSFYSDTINDPNPPSLQASGLSGVFGGSVVNFNAPVPTNKGLVFRGFENNVNTLARSVLVRIVPAWTGVPPRSMALFTTGFNPLNNVAGMSAVVNSDGTMNWFVATPNGGIAVNATLSSPLTFTTNTPTDILMTWDGTTGANGVKIYQDGVLLQSFTASNASFTVNNLIAADLSVGFGPAALAPTYLLNEFVIWEGALSVGTDIVYPRSNFITAANFNGDLNTDPGIANVKIGTNYFSAGVALTGIYTGADRWSDPGVTNVKVGTAYNANAVAKTGSYDGSDRYTDPGIANVESGVAYTFNTLSKTGTLLSTDPGIANVRNGTLYSINSASLTGTFQPVNNIMKQMQILENPVVNQTLTITQGDSIIFNLQAIDDTGLAHDLTGATFTTTLVNTDGSLCTMANSAHVANPDQAGNRGDYTVRLSNTGSLRVGVHQIQTTIVQGPDTIHFWGSVLILSSTVK